jgi:hypothetical protein
LSSLLKEKEEKRKTTQAAKHSLHQLRKRRHIGPKKIVGIRRVAGSPLLQTQTLMHRVSMQF